jgi:hypothetical protein
MSGDMCTSLGNGLTNWLLAKYIVEEKKGGRLLGFVEGDDGIFSADKLLTAEDYLPLGFTIEIDQVRDPCTASFCGMIFGETGDIIRCPFKFVSNFAWTQSFIHAGPRIMDELLRAKALSTLFETPQCPIIGAFAHYALGKTAHAHPRFVDDGYHRMPENIELDPFEPSPETRELFAEVYRIPVQLQLHIEAAVRRGDWELVSQLMSPSRDTVHYSARYLKIT